MLNKLWLTPLGKRLYRGKLSKNIRNLSKLILQTTPKDDVIIDDRDQLVTADKVLMIWPENCPKPRIGLVRDRRVFPYWTKFERFLVNNDISFDYYDVHKSNWAEESGRFDVILWIPIATDPCILEEIRKKIYFFEKYSGKICFPSFDTLMWYEDKIIQYQLLRKHNFPIVDTFISYDLAETLEMIPRLKYPLVAKSSFGAGSMNVEIVNDLQQAEKIARLAFSPVGRTTYVPYFRQKNYVYFQKFQKNEGYDLRVIVIGNLVVGYYRDVPKGDFRASGMHTERFCALPEDAVMLAREVAEKLDEIAIAIDMLRNPEDGKLSIIEIGSMIEIDVLGDLRIDDKRGVYTIDSNNEICFQPGSFWTNEFILREFLSRRWVSKF